MADGRTAAPAAFSQGFLVHVPAMSCLPLGHGTRLNFRVTPRFLICTSVVFENSLQSRDPGAFAATVMSLTKQSPEQMSLSPHKQINSGIAITSHVLGLRVKGLLDSAPQTAQRFLNHLPL